MKFIYIDATYFKIRENGRYGNKALYVCIGIDSDGRREILSCKLCDSETEMEWESFFDDLKERGLKGIELVISDGHKGIQESVTRSFLGAAWQYCHVHFMRNLMKLIHKKKQSSVSEQGLYNGRVLHTFRWMQRSVPHEDQHSQGTGIRKMGRHGENKKTQDMIF